jgi:tRNA modification GTPase
LNALAESDVAIVSEFAGTTRDVLEVNLDIEGYLVRLFDTAGLRQTVDPIEQIGIGRAMVKIDEADLVLGLNDGVAGLPDEVSDLPNLIRVRTKSDIAQGLSDGFDLEVSAKTGAGLGILRKKIAALIGTAVCDGDQAIVTRTRQEVALQRALEAVKLARFDAPQGIEIISHHIHNTELALASLVGEIGVEEVLGAVFTRFCVGK